MSLVPFGEEIYQSIVDVNNGQYTETFSQGDDAEFDIDVESTSTPDPSSLGYNFSSLAAGAWNNNPGSCSVNVFSIGFGTNVEINSVSASVTVSTDVASSECYDGTSLIINGTEVDSTPGSSDNSHVTLSGSRGNFTDNSINITVHQDYSENPLRVNDVDFDVDFGVNHSTNVNSITKS